MAPTQKELAKFAGVSAGTVSNVISGVPGVSERARRKVENAIKALDYQPNLIARSLKTNKTNTLGMIVPDITVPFFPKIIRGAESAAREAGYFLTVLDSENNPTREAAMMALLKSQRVEGVLLVAAGGIQSPVGTLPLTPSSCPMVCLDRLPENLELDSVCVDDSHAAQIATAHLIQMGHRSIAVVTGPLTFLNEQERLRGYQVALQEAGIPVREELVWRGSFDQEDVSRVCQKGLLRPGKKPTALLATNGVTGLAMLRSLYAVGMSTPEDVACVVFDEIAAEEFFRPAVTTIVQPAQEIGRRGIEVLLKRIRGEGSAGHYEHVRLPATLIVRESSKGKLKSLVSQKLRKGSGC